MNIDKNAPLADAQSLTTVHTLLSNRCRRHAIEALSNREPPIALADLADAVAARESEMEADDVFGHTADELVPVLHHIHLPKLADENVIEYNSERNVVTSVEREVLTPLENARCSR